MTSGYLRVSVRILHTGTVTMSNLLRIGDKNEVRAQDSTRLVSHVRPCIRVWVARLHLQNDLVPQTNLQMGPGTQHCLIMGLPCSPLQCAV